MLKQDAEFSEHHRTDFVLWKPETKVNAYCIPSLSGWVHMVFYLSTKNLYTFEDYLNLPLLQ